MRVRIRLLTPHSEDRWAVETKQWHHFIWETVRMLHGQGNTLAAARELLNPVIIEVKNERDA